jgi:hypothetical protein
MKVLYRLSWHYLTLSLSLSEKLVLRRVMRLTHSRRIVVKAHCVTAINEQICDARGPFGARASRRCSLVLSIRTQPASIRTSIVPRNIEVVLITYHLYLYYYILSSMLSNKQSLLPLFLCYLCAKIIL